MSPFRKKRILSQETLGEYLRKVRLGHNWTIEVASQKTKIAPHYIKALEKSQYDDIPGEVYITNFIKVYSQKLSLEPLRTLEQYELEKHVIEQKNHHRFLKEIGNLKLVDFLLKPKNIKTGAICLVVAVVLSYIAFNIYHTVAPPYLEILHPQKDIETTDLTITIQGQSQAEAQVTINNQEVLLKPDGYFEKNINLRAGLNLIVICARKRHGFEKKIIRHILVITANPIAQTQPLNPGT